MDCDPCVDAVLPDAPRDSTGTAVGTVVTIQLNVFMKDHVFYIYVIAFIAILTHSISSDHPNEGP